MNTAQLAALETIRREIELVDDLRTMTDIGSELNTLIEMARKQYRTLRELSTATTEPAAVMAPASGHIEDGKYRLEFSDGEHVMLRVNTQDLDSTFFPGKQVVAYLDGTEDQWHNWKTFGRIEGNAFVGFRKYEGQLGRERAALSSLMASKEAQLNATVAYGKQTGRCGICGRTLTNPESIALGIGPICRERFN